MSLHISADASRKGDASFNAALVGDSSALIELANTAPVQRLAWSLAKRYGVVVDVRRDDLLHPKLGGNKLYKLAGHLHQYYAQHTGKTIVSFGGAYSNHLYALAAAGERLQLPVVGVVRGEKPPKLSQTLMDVQSMGMRLVFISRADYRLKHNSEYQAVLAKSLGLSSIFWLPEGGDGEAGLVGCRVLGRALAHTATDQVWQACGTGTTLLGVAQGMISTDMRSLPQLMGVAALKSNYAIVRKLRANLPTASAAALPWSVTNQHCVGGFARTNPEFKHFMSEFMEETGLMVDHVYTAKIFFALSTLIKAGVYAPTSRLLVVHSGGLQGSR